MTGRGIAAVLMSLAFVFLLAHEGSWSQALGPSLTFLGSLSSLTAVRRTLVDRQRTGTASSPEIQQLAA